MKITCTLKSEAADFLLAITANLTYTLHLFARKIENNLCCIEI